MTTHPNAPTPSLHLGSNHWHGPTAHEHDGEPGHSHGSDLAEPAVPAPRGYSPLRIDGQGSWRGDDSEDPRWQRTVPEDARPTEAPTALRPVSGPQKFPEDESE